MTTNEELDDRLGYTFADPSLLELALSHPSFAHEADGTRGNERLEFLGDAVLDLVVAQALYEAHDDWEEGQLTRARSALVNRRALATCARSLGLGPFLRLGRTERRGGGEDKDSILANCFEAVVGALYLDGGLAPVRALADRVYARELARGAAAPERDPKTELNELALTRFGTTPEYRTVDDTGGENDAERFTVEALVKGERWGEGVGRSKRVAELAAAAAALAHDRATGG